MRNRSIRIPVVAAAMFHLIAALLPLCLATARAQAPTSGNLDTSEKVTARLKEILKELTETIGERNLEHPQQLNQAADYIEKTFESFDYATERQEFDVMGHKCFNVIAELKGTKSPNEIVLIGAHYDSVRGTPGANDNGSGVAAMLLIAEVMRKQSFAKTVRFVAFANEEPPYFQRDGQMGSWVYARQCRKRGDDLKYVISLETMGYFTDEENSQQYPPLVASMYPSTGNFIGFVSNLQSRNMLQDVVKVFRKHCPATELPSEFATLPGEMQGVGWSDHWSFWQEGYQGLMITDTAPFRYPHYHLSSDTMDKIEFVRFTKLVKGLARTVAELCGKG